MDYVLKLTLIASIVLMGYSLSQIFTGYKATCEKYKELKDVIAAENFTGNSVKSKNLVMVSALSLVYVSLVYFSDFAYGVVAIVALKMVMSFVLSMVDLEQILKHDSFGKGLFLLDWVDYLLNFIVGLGIALLLVL